MKLTHCLILVGSFCAGTAIATAAEVNVRWSRPAVANSVQVQKSRAQKRWISRGRVKKDATKSEQSYTRRTDEIRQRARNLRLQISLDGRTGVRVLVNGNRQENSDQRSLVNVFVGGQTGASNITPVSAVQKPGSCVQKARPVSRQTTAPKRPLQK